MQAFADEVWVLTRSNSRELIEENLPAGADQLHFIYYDLPAWARRLKHRRGLIYLYFIAWQFGAYRAAAKQHQITPFDCVYHVTMTSLQLGSYMHRLGVPLVVGPIAGGERAPFRLRRGLTLGAQIAETFRDLGILLQRFNPLARPAFAAAKRILVTSNESLRLVPPRYRGKTLVQLAIASDQQNGKAREATSRAASFVFAGRLLHWKGIHLAIRALAEARRVVPSATLTIYGSGPAEKWLRGVAVRSSLSDAVEFAGRISQESLIEKFDDFTALVFPSLHDSGGLVVLEALSRGLPAVCLDLGGPGEIVDQRCGVVVSTAGRSEAAVVKALAEAMIRLASMTCEERGMLSRGAFERASELTWSSLTARAVSGMES
jgi:glycosyltransferase involved in cell wall biosynthesis